MDKFLFLTKLSSAFYMFVHILILDAHFSLGFWDTTVYWFASCPSVCFFSVSFVSSSSSSFRSINVSEPQGSSHFTLILSLFCNLFQTCGFNNTYKLSILFPDQVFLKIWADSLWIWCQQQKDGKEDVIVEEWTTFAASGLCLSLTALSHHSYTCPPHSGRLYEYSSEPLQRLFLSISCSLSSTTTNPYLGLSGHFH